VFATATDGLMRCLPPPSGGVTTCYTDAACTQPRPLSIQYTSCPGPSVVGAAGACGETSSAWQLKSALSTFPALYQYDARDAELLQGDAVLRRRAAVAQPVKVVIE
jgi:hypothetical protein